MGGGGENAVERQEEKLVLSYNSTPIEVLFSLHLAQFK